MKKVLFIIRDFKTGGIPRCLQSILQLIDTTKYEIDLVCLHQLGPYCGNMPNCRVHKQDAALYHLLQFRKDYNGNMVTYIYKFMNQFYSRLFKRSLIDCRLQKIAKKLSYKYDSVVAYSGGISSELAQLIEGSKRIVWVHNDYAFEPARDDQRTDFNKFDKIVCVSDSAKKSFQNVYTALTEKTVAIYNIINDSFIQQEANEYISDQFDGNYFNIVSVGRICWQKNFNVIPSIIKSINQEKRDLIKWYIIGNGSEAATDELMSEIKKYGVEQQCILIGPKSNPYPYIKNANLFVLTSIHESFCLVIHEALALGVPVISVPIPVVEELLGNHIMHTLDEIPAAIESFFNEESLCHASKSYADHNGKILRQLDMLF